MGGLASLCAMVGTCPSNPFEPFQPGFESQDVFFRKPRTGQVERRDEPQVEEDTNQLRGWREGAGPVVAVLRPSLQGAHPHSRPPGRGASQGNKLRYMEKHNRAALPEPVGGHWL